MPSLIWMSDPHFTKSGLVSGHDPRVRLSAALDFANLHYGDAQVCVISGDMVNHGTAQDYEALQTHLEHSDIAILPMVGNHDDRAAFKSTLSVPDTCMDDFVQYSVEIDGGLIVCLDTQKTGSDCGVLCAQRLAWLKQTLEGANDLPVYIFMHHPPMQLGLPMQDTDSLENPQDFWDVVTGFDCVKYLFIGHVHRPISGVVNAIPFSTMRSILYQAPAPRPDWTWDTFAPANEAPNFGVIEVSDGAVMLQYVQFCDFETGVDQT